MDSVVIGNVLSVIINTLGEVCNLCRKNIFLILQSSSADGIYVARHVLLKCGIPVDKPALHVNRLCGSGFQAIVNGALVGIYWYFYYFQ